MVTHKPDTLVLQQRMPHVDNTEPYCFAILHYLSPEPQGGTSLYRHKSTGYEMITKDRLDPYLRTLESEIRRDGPPPMAYLYGSSPHFEEIASIEGRFNRLAVYNCAVLHSGQIAPDFVFSDDPLKGRLTTNIFINGAKN